MAFMAGRQAELSTRKPRGLSTASVAQPLLTAHTGEHTHARAGRQCPVSTQTERPHHGLSSSASANSKHRIALAFMTVSRFQLAVWALISNRFLVAAIHSELYCPIF